MVVNKYSLPLASAFFLLGLHLGREGGGSMFFRNFWLSQNYMAL
jgi:hypothetical protein